MICQDFFLTFKNCFTFLTLHTVYEGQKSKSERHLKLIGLLWRLGENLKILLTIQGITGNKRKSPEYILKEIF